MTRWWGRNLSINGARQHPNDKGPPLAANLQAQYEVLVQDTLREMSNRPAGGLLIDWVNKTRGSVVICPMPPGSAYNSITTPDKQAGANKFTLNPTPTCGNTACTGGGSDITIYYTPSMWFDPLNPEAAVAGGHYQTDDVLFHELVHAVRGMLGLWDQDPILVFDNVEDFYAVTLTNIYLSLNRRAFDMRGSHAPRWETLNPKEENAFYLRYFSHIDALASTMPKFFGDFAALPGGWNPLRAKAVVDGNMERMRLVTSFGVLDMLSPPPSLGGPANVIPVGWGPGR